MNWYIISGPSQIGKSRLSKSLKHHFGFEIVSTDELFEMKYGSISDFIASVGNTNEGWLEFRKRESEVLRDFDKNYLQEGALYSKEIVLDLGGGLLAPQNSFHSENPNTLDEILKIRDSNLELLKERGKILTLLPYDNLENSIKVMQDIAVKKARKGNKSNRVIIDTDNDNKIRSEVEEKLKMRWSSYRDSSDFIYFIGNQKPLKCDEGFYGNIDPVALNVKQIYDSLIKSS